MWFHQDSMVLRLTVVCVDCGVAVRSGWRCDPVRRPNHPASSDSSGHVATAQRRIAARSLVLLSLANVASPCLSHRLASRLPLTLPLAWRRPRSLTDTCRVVPPSLITCRYVVGDTRPRAPRAGRQRASCSRCARPRSSPASCFSSPIGCSASCSSASPTSSSAACCIVDDATTTRI